MSGSWSGNSRDSLGGSQNRSGIRIWNGSGVSRSRMKVEVEVAAEGGIRAEVRAEVRARVEVNL